MGNALPDLSSLFAPEEYVCGPLGRTRYRGVPRELVLVRRVRNQRDAPFVARHEINDESSSVLPVRVDVARLEPSGVPTGTSSLCSAYSAG